LASSQSKMAKQTLSQSQSILAELRELLLSLIYADMDNELNEEDLPSFHLIQGEAGLVFTVGIDLFYHNSSDQANH
jgi:hypothetical protein